MHVNQLVRCITIVWALHTFTIINNDKYRTKYEIKLYALWVFKQVNIWYFDKILMRNSLWCKIIFDHIVV